MRRTRKHWSQIFGGIAMLGVAALGPTVALANAIGIGKALAAIMLGLLIAAWVITGAILIARGLSKM